MFVPENLTEIIPLQIIQFLGVKNCFDFLRLFGIKMREQILTLLPLYTVPSKGFTKKNEERLLLI